MSAAPSFRETAATTEAAQSGLLYERYSHQLLGFCRARLSSREEAEDAVQQTFLNAHRSLRKGTVPRAEAAWMYAIAANVCRERHRSAWRRSRVEVVSDDGLVGERPAPEHSHEELAGVADALAELTENQRRAILMREWQGLSYREIAAELSLTEGAVETLLFRARRSLAQKLDRSRGGIWNFSNVGSALAWGKTVLGGTAGQIAAATLVVGAGMTAAAPFVPVHGSAHRAVAISSRHATSAPARALAATPHHARAAALARTKPAVPVVAHKSSPVSRPVASSTQATPAAPVSAPVPGTRPAPPGVPLVAAPAPPAVPPVPKVEAPPVPQVPPVSAVPPVPRVPPVSVPGVPVPELPKLP